MPLSAPFERTIVTMAQTPSPVLTNAATTPSARPTKRNPSAEFPPTELAANRVSAAPMTHAGTPTPATIASEDHFADPLAAFAAAGFAGRTASTSGARFRASSPKAYASGGSSSASTASTSRRVGSSPSVWRAFPRFDSRPSRGFRAVRGAASARDAGRGRFRRVVRRAAPAARVKVSPSSRCTSFDQGRDRLRNELPGVLHFAEASHAQRRQAVVPARGAGGRWFVADGEQTILRQP